MTFDLCVSFSDVCTIKDQVCRRGTETLWFKRNITLTQTMMGFSLLWKFLKLGGGCSHAEYSTSGPNRFHNKLLRINLDTMSYAHEKSSIRAEF